MADGRIICITGGIGSGKSVVCRILSVRGYRVIDTDALARRIMDESDIIKTRIKSGISTDVIRDNNSIDRKLLADIVFNDASKLLILNAIVHEQVRERLRAISVNTDASIFVETAIFFESGLNTLADAEWRVEAPLENRIERVMKRNSLTRAEVMSRIHSQQVEGSETDVHPALTIIQNDGDTPLLPQIDAALIKYGMASLTATLNGRDMP